MPARPERHNLKLCFLNNNSRVDLDAYISAKMWIIGHHYEITVKIQDTLKVLMCPSIRGYSEWQYSRTDDEGKQSVSWTRTCTLIYYHVILHKAKPVSVFHSHNDGVIRDVFGCYNTALYIFVMLELSYFINECRFWHIYYHAIVLTQCMTFLCFSLKRAIIQLSVE